MQFPTNNEATSPRVSEGAIDGGVLRGCPNQGSPEMNVCEPWNDAGPLYFTGSEGLSPNLRVNSKINPLKRIHALIADFDSPIEFQETSMLAARAGDAPLPNWYSRTKSGHARLVWLFAAPVVLDNESLCKAFLVVARKELRLTLLLPGLDEGAWKRLATQLFEKGSDWKQISADAIPINLVHAWLFEASRNADFKNGSVSIPLATVEDEIERRGWLLHGTLEIGSRCNVFWDGGSNDSSCVIQETGVVCFSRDKSFYSWRDIFGSTFVKKYETDRIGSAASGAHYDGFRFWVANNGEYLSRSKDDYAIRLKVKHGIHARTNSGETSSELERVISFVQEQRSVSYAALLAGYKAGAIECSGKRILVTTSPKLIEPEPGAWPTLDRLLSNLLIDGEHDQRPYVYAWLKTAIEALWAEQRRPGPVLILAGPRDCGKSLLQNLITELLGGRSSKPYRYMSGRTDFNGDLFGAEHLAIEDEAPSTDVRSRRAFGTHIKSFAVNEDHSCHAKGRQALTLKPFWRVSISVNDEPENLMILPPIDESITDKIVLLRSRKAEMPMPTETLAERATFWNTLMAELPAFSHFLLEWQIPAALRHGRYGFKTWHNPHIRASLDAMAPEMRLLSLIDEVIFSAEEVGIGRIIPSDVWEGSAEMVEKRLFESVFDYEAKRLLSWTNATGTYLGRLAARYPDRVGQLNSWERPRKWKIRRHRLETVADAA